MNVLASTVASAALLAASLALPASAASPDPYSCVSGLTPGALFAMMDEIGEITGLPVAATTPRILCVPEQTIEGLAERAAGDSREHLAGYDPDARVIYLNDAYDFVADKPHVLAHELTHHQQWQSGVGAAMTSREREAQARVVERQF